MKVNFHVWIQFHLFSYMSDERTGAYQVSFENKPLKHTIS